MLRHLGQAGITQSPATHRARPGSAEGIERAKDSQTCLVCRSRPWFTRICCSAAHRKLTVSYRGVSNRVICATAFVDSIRKTSSTARWMLNRRTGWVMSSKRKGRVIATFSFRGWGRERCPSAKKNPDPSFKLLTGGQK